MRVLVVITTGIAAVLSSFITICRVIQIQVVYDERDMYSGCWKVLNRISAALNIIGHLCLFLMTVFVDGNAHLTLAVIGVTFMLFFTMITSVLSIKERLVLYRLFGETYYVDALLQA